MGKVTLSIEELMNFMRGEVPLETVRKQMASALVEMWTNHPEVRAELDAHAEELAREKVERLIKSAFNEQKPAYWNNNRWTFTGWAAGIIEKQINEAMKVAGVESGMPMRRMVEDALQKVRADYTEQWNQTLNEIRPFVATEVRNNVNRIVTEEYRERVAANFDEQHIDELLQEMVTKAIGGMLMSGALTFNGGRQA